MFVIATGNAFDGIVLHGPFATMEEAHEWAELSADYWECVLIYPVKENSGS